MSSLAAIFISIAVLWAMLATAISSHARRRGKNAVLWGTVVFMTGVFGVAVYAVSLSSE